MSKSMKEDCPELETKCAEIASKPGYADEICIQAKKKLPADTHPVIDKIVARRHLADPDLCGVNPLAMFVSTWLLVQDDPDSIKSMTDILRDVGGTCLQGDTHRLYSLYLALKRSCWS
jgi:hypothetical protein